jgi:glycosyltransferase involved in cell wall biosynthesis
MSALKILYIIGQLGIGGAEKQLIQLVTHLDRSKYKPIVCSLSKNSPLASQLAKEGIKVVILPRRYKPDLTRAWFVTQCARMVQPTLIHTYLFVGDTWGRIAGKILNIPVIISERSTEDYKLSLFNIIDQLLAKSTSAVIANSIAGSMAAKKRGKIEADIVKVIYNGIDVNSFSDKSKRSMVREEFGIGDDLLLGTIGRLDPPKDYKTLFLAVRDIISEFPKIKLLCVGDGKQRIELQQFACNIRIEDSIIFTGMRSDIKDLLSAIDIFVFSSLREGIPNVILEAMAASLPVVATNVGGVSELVVEGSTGYLVPPECPMRLSKAIIEILNDSTLASSLGRHGQLHAQECFSVEKMVRETEAVYRDVLLKAR